MLDTILTDHIFVAIFAVAYPVYDLRFQTGIERVLSYLESIDLTTLGRFARYRYVNSDQIVIMIRDALKDRFPVLS